MTTAETRRFEMLLRVQEFGKAHQDQFPASSPGGQAFEALAAVVRQLGEEAVSKQSTTREGRHKKKAARASLLDYLDTMSRCARIVARDEPGFDDKYKVGRLRSDQAILTAGKTFAREAATSSSLFIKYGMRESFIAELNGLVDECDTAIRAWQGAKDGHTSARANIESALDEGFAIVRRLDIFVANQLRGDSGAVAVWARDRRYEGPRPGRRAKRVGGAPAEPPTSTTPAPPPEVAPAMEAPAPNTDAGVNQPSPRLRRSAEASAEAEAPADVLPEPAKEVA